MLYLVKFEKLIVSVWTTREEIAIGESEDDAINFIKAKFDATDKIYKNFKATPITIYDDYGNQTYNLYKVTYKDWNSSCSDLISRTQLSIGRCYDEAILYSKAYARSDARDFDAMEIKSVHGHTISVN